MNYTGGGASENSSLKGFTLAEVLITLGIIGIVAAMTLPTILANYKKKVTAVRLQKIYSEIYAAFKMAEVENYPMSEWDFSGFNENDREKVRYFVDNYLIKYLNVATTCESGNNKCFSRVYNKNRSTGVKTGAWCDRDYRPNSKSFITVSGYSALVYVAANGLDGGVCVDIDGPSKGEGIMGQDVFLLYWVGQNSDFKSGFYTYGRFEKDVISRNKLMNDSRAGCKSSGNPASAIYCAALIETDGWKIKDDYPW